jgi:amidophosphoribosyltransferase
MCGFIGLYGDERTTATELADALLVLQHRGQDAAGIATFDGDSFHMERGAGMVRELFTPSRLALLPGRFAIGHTRYPTVGGGTGADAQPLYTNSPFGIAMAHNGNVTNFPEMKKELSEQHGRRLGTDCDVEVILNVFAGHLAHRGPEKWVDDACAAMKQVFKRVKGSYSGVALVGGRGLVAFRDPFGIKPAAVGRRKSGKGWHWCVTSESAVLNVLGFETVGDLDPGEVMLVTPDGQMVRRRVAGRGQAQHRPCVFEYIYFARPDSVIDDISVYRARLRLGEMLAKHVRARGLKPDVVVPVPDSARPAALECAHALGVRYREGLLKNRYVGRTFIMPGQANRAKSVHAKLTTLPMELENKKVLLVDDSIVRGTTTRAVVEMVRKAGAREVYLAVSAPKIMNPCVYGIDMQTRSEFLARREKTDDRIAKAIGAEAVVYMTLDDMVTAVRGPTKRVKQFCMACMDGNYPTGDVTPDMLRTIESERTRASRVAEAKSAAQQGLPEPASIRRG